MNIAAMTVSAVTAAMGLFTQMNGSMYPIEFVDLAHVDENTVVVDRWHSPQVSPSIVYLFDDTNEQRAQNNLPVFPTIVDFLADGETLAATLISGVNDGIMLDLADRWVRQELSEARAAFILSEALNDQVPDSNIDCYTVVYFAITPNNQNVTTDDQIINTVAKTLAHEIGHAVGLVHTASGGKQGSHPDALNDIMANVSDFAGTLGFKTTDLALRVALGWDWVFGDVKDTLNNYYLSNIQQGSFESLGELQLASDVRIQVPPGPVLTIEEMSSGASGRLELDLGSVTVDGVGGAQIVRELRFHNNGNEDLVVNGIDVDGDAPGITFTSIEAGSRIDPGEFVSLTMTFDPLQSGKLDFRLIVRSNSIIGTGGYPISIKAEGVSPGAEIRVESTNTNVGGLALGEPPTQVADLATIRNTGGQALSIFAIKVVDNSNQFAITGLPGQVSRTNPLVLAPNEEQNFGLLFDAKQIGLQEGEIQIFTDDPNTPIFTLPVIGTGLADTGPESMVKLGNDHVLVTETSQDAGPSQLLITDAAGNFKATVRPNAPIRIMIYDPASGLIADLFGQSGPDGTVTRTLSTFNFGASTAPDEDGNGTPDDIDLILGTGAHQQSRALGSLPRAATCCTRPAKVRRSARLQSQRLQPPSVKG